ncbi:MAG: type II toxin-antitoxin system VapC family toxin [Anaerolineales bacterium]|nr:type II toxin-antitoxin system VapC family toxin [Anaerolineales bacterium]
MGTIVLDASAVMPLMIPHPLTPQAEQAILQWKVRNDKLISPCFMPVEIVSALRQLVYLGKLDTEKAVLASRLVMRLGIQFVCPTPENLEASLLWAERLGQSKAYDAHYIAVSEAEGAEFWSADRRLINNLQSQGVEWAHWLGEIAP